MFKTIKDRLTVAEVASYYGLKVNRKQMCECPFHKDKHPSMKLNRDYYYCFSCTATGDAVGLVASLYGLSQKDAAMMIIKDFNLDIETASHTQKQLNTENELRAFHRQKRDALFVLHRYMDLLRQARDNFPPATPEDLEDCHPLFVEALMKLPLLEDIDEGLTYENLETQKEILRIYGGTIENVRNRLQELNQL